MSVDAENTQLLREQKPKKNTACSTLGRDANWKCFVLTSLIVGCLTSICWCRLAVVKKVTVNFRNFPITSRHETSPCTDGYIYIPVAFLVMLYLVYLVECWHCNTRIELCRRVDVGSVYDDIRLMRESHPVIWWKCVCYHYVRRSRQISRYRNGESYTTTHVYYERVNTHTSGSSFAFSRCGGVEDISRNLVDLERFPITKIRYSKGFAFANIDAANEFEEQRARFFQHNERQDDYMEMREGLDFLNVVDDFKENVVAFADPDRLPWYISKLAFWVASVFLLSWPLRVAIEYNTAYVHYQVTKLFGNSDSTTRQGRRTFDSRIGVGTYYGGSMTMPLHRIDSNDLEQINFTIVPPSYSEALLLTSAISDPANDLYSSDGNVEQAMSGTRRDTSLTTNYSLLRRARWISRRRSWALDDTTITRPRSFTATSCWLIASVPPGCRTLLVTSRTIDRIVQGPPEYEEALRTCRPINIFLRRSMTDRDIVRRAHDDFKLTMPHHVETAL